MYSSIELSYLSIPPRETSCLSGILRETVSGGGSSLIFRAVPGVACRARELINHSVSRRAPGTGRAGVTEGLSVHLASIIRLNAKAH